MRKKSQKAEKPKSLQRTPTPEPPASLLRFTFRAFAWIEDSLQNIISARGWPRGSHTQSMILLAVGEGITRPSDLARCLGLSRQAIHQALEVLTERKILELRVDPDDRRSRIVQYSPEAAPIIRDTRNAFRMIDKEIAKRIGEDTYRIMFHGLSQDWGDPIGSDGDIKTPRIPRRRLGD